MLKNAEPSKAMGKMEYKQVMDELEVRLSSLQRQCREYGIPVCIVMDGLEAVGKGVQIGKLMKALDPRGFRVYAVHEDSEDEKRYPFLWKYWNMTPAKGEIVILDSSWYRKVTIELFDKDIKQNDMPVYLDEIRCFEKQLVDSGVCLIKYFMHVNKKEQKKRMESLSEEKETSWRVTKADLKKNKNYEIYVNLVKEVLDATNTAYAPWNIVCTMERRRATVEIYRTIIGAIEERIKAVNLKQVMEDNKPENPSEELEEVYAKTEGSEDDGMQVLQNVNLEQAITEEEYAVKLDKLQKKIQKLHGELYRQKVPMILGFEGWDAAGKGGAIRRLTEKMDPRGYVVHPVASPTSTELSHHYLWRFWKEIPKAGHVTIFDRTWYGRVMVERVEGFCSEEDWKRAYQEINDMETSFHNAGAIVLKFWIHIDKDEQERRFNARNENPEKQWKITEEDWRNRAKWSEYEVAVNEMIARTSTKNAPWIIVEGNDKKYARIKVLETVIAAMEQRLNK